jgi:hypothetical protein
LLCVLLPMAAGVLKMKIRQNTSFLAVALIRF